MSSRTSPNHESTRRAGSRLGPAARTFLGTCLLVVITVLATGCASTLPGASLGTATTLRVEDSAAAPEPYFDLGDFGRRISTSSTEAQVWFDRGLLQCYSFNHEEGLRCFERAVEADPSCAMAHFGIAWASGPYINNPAMDEAGAKRAFEAAEAAAALLDRCAAATSVERRLIAAIGQRYEREDPEDRRRLDEAWADAMREVRRDFPNDPDVAAWFAESLMVLRPWGHWSKSGEAAPETGEIVATLESGLALDPDHPALAHFYIHTMEASPFPEKALAAADRLRDLAPEAGHLVHMPSHVDIRLGRSPEAIEANRRAIIADAKYADFAGRDNFYTLYRIHDYHFLVYAAMFDGQRRLAIEHARALTGEIPDSMLAAMPEMLEAFLPTALHVLVRFGAWDEILAEPRPRPDRPMETAVWHYARGIALATKGRVEEAEREQRAFESAAARVPEAYALFNNSASSILGIARTMLEGEIEYRKGAYDAAFAALREAVRLDDDLNYDEPWGWMQPTRHALGALLLEQGRAEEALEVYRTDLDRNPNNGWALHGMSRCLRKLGRDREADVTEAKFREAWKRSDVAIAASCYCAIGATPGS